MDASELSTWLPAVTGVVGALGGAAVTGWLAYRREVRLRRDDREHAAALRAEDEALAAALRAETRALADEDALAQRVRSAYLGLLQALHEVNGRHVEWIQEIHDSGAMRTTFAFADLDAALAVVQLAVPKAEAEELQAVLDQYARSHFEKLTESRTAVLEIYRARR